MRKEVEKAIYALKMARDHMRPTVFSHHIQELNDAIESLQAIPEDHVFVSKHMIEGALSSLREAAINANPVDRVYLASTVKLFATLLSEGK